MIRLTQFAGIIFATVWVLPASAQSNHLDAQNSPSVADPKACAPSERLEQGPRGPKAPATTGQGENVTDKLARTDGVFCPPDIDPGIEAPTPDLGRMPIARPPGSPGGDPNVRPK